MDILANRISLLWRGVVLAVIVSTALLASPVRPASAATATAVSADGNHGCALITSGGLKCWGGNIYGQLGDGTFRDRSTPADVTGLTSGVASVYAGGNHACAVTTSGGVKCWGSSFSGQLGDGSSALRPTPVDVTGLTSGVASVSAGGYHTCAVTESGGLKCWGSNGSGRLGDGTSTQRLTPVDVTGLTSGVTSVSGGGSHTCAVTTAGGLKCWGWNRYGQLGDGTATDRFTPVDVSGLTSGVASVSTGSSHTCAVTTSGGLKCWGWNQYGQLGDGTTTDRSTPVDVSGLTSGVASVSTGSFHTCAVTTPGGLKCWGRNTDGQLGDGTTTQRSTPVEVTGLTSGVSSVSAGWDHTCAMTTSGRLKCWGFNRDGQLGDGTTTQRSTPVGVTGLTSGVASVSTGFSHTCAVTTSGGLKCWGWNRDGQLGDGTTAERSTPVDVTGLASGVASVSAGRGHTCVLTTSGALKCWGSNGYGQLGDGTTIARSTPVDVTGLTSGVASVSAGGYFTLWEHTCAVTASGGLKCWGRNRDGQLGNGTTTDRSTPVDVTGLTSGVASVSAGGSHTCAVTASGGLKCWGRNFYGQLGDGTTTDRSTPVDVTGLTSGVAAVSAESSHTCAVTTSGGLKCWGRNFNGQLGDGTTTDRSTPVHVTGLTSGVASVSTGFSHSCAVTTSDGLRCWGWNVYGQLGDGRPFFRTTPVQVVGFMKAVGADLAVTKSDSPDPVLAGDDLKYTMTVANSGPSTSTGVLLTDILPVGVTFVSSTPGPPTCAASSGTVTCNLGALAMNASTTVTIQVAVNGSTTGTITNTVSVAGNEVDPDTSNNTTTASTLVNPSADLSVAKGDSPDPVLASADLTYTLMVTNNGPGTSTNVTLTDTLPAGTSFRSSTPAFCIDSAGTVTCSLGTLLSGETTTVAVEVVVGPSTRGTLTNTATVSSDETDPDATDNSATATTTVSARVDLSISKVDSPDPRLSRARA